MKLLNYKGEAHALKGQERIAQHNMLGNPTCCGNRKMFALKGQQRIAQHNVLGNKK